MHTVIQTDRHTDIHTYILTLLQTYLHAMQTVGPETSFKAGLGAMEIACSAMEIAATQTLCEDEANLEAGLETGLEGMEIAIGCYENCSKTDTLLG